MPDLRRSAKKSKERHACTFDGCQEDYADRKGLKRHVQHVHGDTKKRHACTFDGCQKDYALVENLRSHIILEHGTPDEIAELQEKKLAIRQYLADKETQGLCSATKSCPHPALEGSFRCRDHEKPVSALDEALKEREENGTLSWSSIQSPDEFALLLQRPKISLDRKSKASLSDLARGMDGVHGSSKAFAMDTEFIQAKGGHLVPLDLTVMRLNGEVVISTRVDWGLTVEGLQDLCKNRISRHTVVKVYGKSGRT